MIFHTAYIAVGSNMGDRLNNCLKGIDTFVKETNAELLAKSKFYKTQPMYVEDQDWFINGVFSVQTKSSPFELFDAAKKIEILLGRDLAAKRYGPRVLDLDILLMDDMIIHTPNLIIPHPRLQERRFVLQPFCDIASGLFHPLLKKSMQELLNDLNDGNQKVYCCQ
ncbi:MAG: 2-amino-4-hydroxy-6-hydroxymethyldihydropteridine diphosphokinase [Candidatus Magnetomorum sp.]|nr:2-amino-4-hydroxy-6-hydroxymethyldihydropteridine diphosphokinase [Candidatus Magnetomorum sp.]